MYYNKVILVCASVLVVILIVAVYGLEIAEKWAQIFAAGSLFIAAVSYTYQKRHDHDIAVIEQIGFFRTEVLSLNEDLIEYIYSIDANAKMSSVSLAGHSLEKVRKENYENGKIQLDLVTAFNRAGNGRKLESLQISVLNALEEFSLRVIRFNSVEAPALLSVRSSFIHIVEANGVKLLMMRQIYLPGTYSGILQLYDFWADSVDRRTAVERLKVVFDSFIHA